MLVMSICLSFLQSHTHCYSILSCPAILCWIKADILFLSSKISRGPETPEQQACNCTVITIKDFSVANQELLCMLEKLLCFDFLLTVFCLFIFLVNHACVVAHWGITYRTFKIFATNQQWSWILKRKMTTNSFLKDCLNLSVIIKTNENDASVDAVLVVCKETGWPVRELSHVNSPIKLKEKQS